jgi:hypothetical protein
VTSTRYHDSAPRIGDLMKGRDRGRHMERTGIKVRRNSVDINDERARRYVLPFHEEEVAAYLQAAERYNLDHKEEGKYVGPFRGRGMDVLRWLLREAKSGKGICSPSHAQIAVALKIGLRSVRRIMKALYLAGFLEWQRRSVEIDADDGGSRREQTSNLYRFNLPAELAGLVKRLVAQRTGRAPAQPRSLRIVGAAELKSRPDFWQISLTGDGRLAGTLAAIGSMIDRSAKDAKLALS